MVALAYRSIGFMSVIFMIMIWFFRLGNSPCASSCLRGHDTVTNPSLNPSNRTFDGPTNTRRHPYGEVPGVPLSIRYNTTTLSQHHQPTKDFVTNIFPRTAPMCQLQLSSIQAAPCQPILPLSPSKIVRQARYQPIFILEQRTTKITYLFVSQQVCPTRQLQTSIAQTAILVGSFSSSPSQNERQVRYALTPTIIGKQTAKSHLFIPTPDTTLEAQTTN